MDKTARKIRIGQINFTNVWPVFHYFNFEAFEEQVEFISQVPSQLNKGMALGQIDMGPISSFAYAEQFEQYVLFPDLSVSSYGKVNSILLFHNKPIEQLKHAKIALPTTSATSVNLLKIIMTKFYANDPAYFFAAPSLQDMMKEADAALLIGDDAIEASMQDHGFEVTDLGELWEKHTGHWMSFAVWAIRQQTADQFPRLVEQIFMAFQQSKQKALSEPEGVINAAQTKLGGSYSFWHDYFSQLCYDFGGLQRDGLQLYYKYAFELGLIQTQVPLKIWSNKTVV